MRSCSSASRAVSRLPRVKSPARSAAFRGKWCAGWVVASNGFTRSMKSVFSCQECGAQAPKWLGRCPECGAWNSFVEEAIEKPGKATERKGAAEPLGGGKATRYADVDALVSTRF